MFLSYLSIRSFNFPGGHTESLPLADLNRIDDLVESIAQVSDEILILFVVPKEPLDFVYWKKMILVQGTGF